MRGIDRLLPIADTANKLALEQKQNIYFHLLFKIAFLVTFCSLCNRCEVCTVITSRKLGGKCGSFQV